MDSFETLFYKVIRSEFYDKTSIITFILSYSTTLPQATGIGSS